MKNELFQISGIKCDKPGCTYRENDIKKEDYPKWLNRPCPICGSNLLTEADLKLVKKIDFLASLVEAFIGKKHLPKGDENQKVVLEMNGTGKIVSAKRED